MHGARASNAFDCCNLEQEEVAFYPSWHPILLSIFLPLVVDTCCTSMHLIAVTWSASCAGLLPVVVGVSIEHAFDCYNLEQEEVKPRRSTWTHLLASSFQEITSLLQIDF